MQHDCQEKTVSFCYLCSKIISNIGNLLNSSTGSRLNSVFNIFFIIILGKGWKPISQVKVSELPVWLLRRDWSPNGVMKGFSRGWWRWNFAYSFRPGKGSYAALIQFALSYSFVMAVIEFGRKSKFCYLFNNLFRCVNIVF